MLQKPAGVFSMVFVLLFAPDYALAHPFNGVTQKTVVSSYAQSALIEYTSHFGTELIVLMHPDKNRDGVLSKEEKGKVLDDVNRRIVPNIFFKINEQDIDFKEIGRELSLEDTTDYTQGITTTYIWKIDFEPGSLQQKTVLWIIDNNFQDQETNKPNYVVNVLGDIGPITLPGKGHELLLNIADTKEDVSVLQSQPEKESILRRAPQNLTERTLAESSEADSLLDFLRSKDRGIIFYSVGLFTAFILGALHALSPGHGKAMVAAYLVGTKGRIRDAILLGGVVTLTHVLSVFVLGVVALIISRYTVTQDFIPWLGVASGVLVFITGYYLLARNAFLKMHHHSHHHSHVHNGHANHGTSGTSLKEIIGLGIAGGVVPCPSAIVILLFAVSVQRIVAGLLLVLSFSLGLACVLIGIGIVVVTASGTLTKNDKATNFISKLPFITAGIIMVLGIALAFNSLLEGGILTFQI